MMTIFQLFLKDSDLRWPDSLMQAGGWSAAHVLSCLLMLICLSALHFYHILCNATYSNYMIQIHIKLIFVNIW